MNGHVTKKGTRYYVVLEMGPELWLKVEREEQS